MNVARLNFSHGDHAEQKGKTALDLQPGDTVVLTSGPINGQVGNTNTIRVEQI